MDLGVLNMRHWSEMVGEGTFKNHLAWSNQFKHSNKSEENQEPSQAQIKTILCSSGASVLASRGIFIHPILRETSRKGR